MTKQTTPSILLTGATGTIGYALAQQLSAQGLPFRALVRCLENSQGLRALPGATVVAGDLNDTNSIARALDGIEKAFLLTNSSEQAETLQNNFVEAAAQAGLQQIVKLSQLAADPHSPVRFLRYHAAVEEKIKQSGIPYTFLRPNLFMQGLLGFREPIAQMGKFFAAIGDAAISLVDIRDIAAVAAKALTEAGHENKIYTLTGPEALTHQQLAERLSEALGRTITFIDVTPADMRQALDRAGFPAWQAEGLIEDYAHYARGEASGISTAIPGITGRPARNFRQFAQDYAAVFQRPSQPGSPSSAVARE
ncbi:SDR family oxidoreductase [Chitinophaga japonensis]|uniref:Uncharacterized protein YbjT (DUF2867 family) n=1 Tax=Chitinophaga japonensis TaxID=104662 RepID=A0A562SJD6_CHIJA|nr:SDR family oxidoreductase [Chitinophaga japonensis]TWI80946.1 uncharacterized protein YbjT (DUF2867 family) [Chitinophaga japonensis]